MTDTVAGPDPDPRAGSPSARPPTTSDDESPDQPPDADTPRSPVPASAQPLAPPTSTGDWSFGSTVGFDTGDSGRPRLTYDPGTRPGVPPAPDDLPDLVFRPSNAPVETPGRHPMDPDTAPSTKAAAVLALGVAALITGPLVGGLVPATLALLLARQAQAELLASRGYLTGARQVRLGLVLAWTGIGLAVIALVAATILGIISLADVNVLDIPDTSD